jgi:hypothetical protein
LGRLRRLAIDSTRVKANASPNRMDSEKKLRAERLRIRRQNALPENASELTQGTRAHPHLAEGRAAKQGAHGPLPA